MYGLGLRTLPKYVVLGVNSALWQCIISRVRANFTDGAIGIIFVPKRNAICGADLLTRRLDVRNMLFSFCLSRASLASFFPLLMR